MAFALSAYFASGQTPVKGEQKRAKRRKADGSHEQTPLRTGWEGGGVKVGRLVRFRREEIERWLRERAVNGRATRLPKGGITHGA